MQDCPPSLINTGTINLINQGFWVIFIVGSIFLIGFATILSRRSVMPKTFKRNALCNMSFCFKQMTYLMYDSDFAIGNIWTYDSCPVAFVETTLTNQEFLCFRNRHLAVSRINDNGVFGSKRFASPFLNSVSEINFESWKSFRQPPTKSLLKPCDGGLGAWNQRLNRFETSEAYKFNARFRISKSQQRMPFVVAKSLEYRIKTTLRLTLWCYAHELVGELLPTKGCRFTFRTALTFIHTLIITKTHERGLEPNSTDMEFLQKEKLHILWNFLSGIN